MKVKSDRLDVILKEVNDIYFIKIDIEGSELYAFETFENFKTMPPYTSFEINSKKKEILSLLESYVFNCFQYVRQGDKFLNVNKITPSKEGKDFHINFTHAHSGSF